MTIRQETLTCIVRSIKLLLVIAVLWGCPPATRAHTEVLAVGPAFQPNIPSSQDGPVSYFYEWGGVADGFAECGPATTQGSVMAKTSHYGTVDSIAVVDNGVAVFRAVRLMGDCDSGAVIKEFDNRCFQTRDGLTVPPTYSPSMGGGVCLYANGEFYGSVGAGPACPVETIEYPGPGWTIYYTRPIDPLCDYFFESDLCTCENSIWNFFILSTGKSTYYSLTVLLDEGVEPPDLGSLGIPLPGPFGTGVSIDENNPPFVAIVSPPDGTEVEYPANLDLKVLAFDGDGNVTGVNIYEGSTPLGPATPIGNNVYTFTWPSPAIGSYSLTARATDNSGNVAISLPIHVTVSLPGPPVITGFSPASGAPGTVVTISGEHFSSMILDNTVYFGAVRAGAVAATANSLQVVLPNGAIHAPITVTVKKRSATSGRSFLPTFDGGGAGISSSTFSEARLDLPASAGPVFSVLADLDRDGRADLVVNNVYSRSFSLYRNISSSGSLDTSSFDPPVNFTVGGSSDNPYGVSVADANGDGWLDVIICDRVLNQVSIYKNQSLPNHAFSLNSLAVPVHLITGSDPRHAVVADFNGDGLPDVVSANFAANKISIFKHTGSAGGLTFDPKADLDSAAGPFDLATGDLNGDGRLDIAVRAANHVSVFLNTSSGSSITFSKTDYAAASGGIGIVIGNINADNLPDVATCSYGSQTISVFANNAGSPGTLDSPVNVFPGCNGHTLALGDLNGDGKVDLSFVGELASKLLLYQNQSSGGSISLGGGVQFGTGWNPWGVSVGDLDGDSRPDIVFCNAYDNKVSIYRNTQGDPPPPPSIPTVSLQLQYTDLIEEYGGWWFGPGFTYFSVIRNGSVSAPLTVYLRIGGGQEHDPMYEAYYPYDFNVEGAYKVPVDNYFQVDIPAGSDHADVMILAEDDYDVEFGQEFLPVSFFEDPAYSVDPAAGTLSIYVVDDD